MRRVAGVTLATALATLALAGCGGDDGNGGAAATQTTTAIRTEATTTTRTEAATTAGPRTTTQTEEAAAAPLDCLEQAGLSNPEQRDDDFWRGGNVRVQRMTSAAEARSAEHDAVDVWAAAAGRYAVFGTFKTSDDSRADVEAVADCLRR
jgi:hypothetical protein